MPVDLGRNAEAHRRVLDLIAAALPAPSASREQLASVSGEVIAAVARDLAWYRDDPSDAGRSFLEFLAAVGRIGATLVGMLEKRGGVTTSESLTALALVVEQALIAEQQSERSR